MPQEISPTELLLTYTDLAIRWNRSIDALYVAASRGSLPKPDYRVDNKPMWTEATIRLAEQERPTLSRRPTKGSK